MKTIFILVDALRSDYLNSTDMPLLYNKAMNTIYVERIIPSFSYCERTEIFSGTLPEKSGYFTAIGYDEKSSPYRNIGCLLKIISFFEKNTISKKVTRFGVRLIRAICSIQMGIYNIPLQSLKYFSLTEDKNNHFNKKGLRVETLIDVLLEDNKSIYSETFTALGRNIYKTDEERCNAIKKVVNENYDFLLLYIESIDFNGHYHTGESVMHDKLFEVDKKIEEIWSLYEENNYNIVVLGDHGMVEVQTYIDVLNELQKLSLVIHKDYELFLDSTMARFWVKDTKKFEILSSFLHSNSIFTANGFFLNKDSAKKLKVPYNYKNSSNKNLYGDLIWCANPGVVICPDYFSNQRKKGMHGYPWNSSKDSNGLMIIKSNKKKKKVKKANLIDVCPTLCCLLNIRYPKDNRGNNIDD